VSENLKRRDRLEGLHGWEVNDNIDFGEIRCEAVDWIYVAQVRVLSRDP
jgi:hypothetical protein